MTYTLEELKKLRNKYFNEKYISCCNEIYRDNEEQEVNEFINWLEENEKLT